MWKDFQDSLGDQSQCRAVHIVFYFLYLKKGGGKNINLYCLTCIKKQWKDK